MSDSTRDLLIHGVAAAKAHEKNEARYFFEWLLRDDTAEPDEQEQAWHYLAQIADDPKEKRRWLEEILAHNPMDAQARRELLILNGALNPADIVDPDQPSPPKPFRPISARRFICSNCGGILSFDAGQNSLTCQYCGNRQSLLSAIDSGGMIAEENFTVTLATTKGHSTPTQTHIIRCTGCGASFQFLPEMISRPCPYCGTPYVLEETESRDLIAPDAIVPFAIAREQAQKLALEWYQSNKFKILSADALPIGIYLPVWAFDIGGVIDWSCVIEANEKWLPESGTALADESDLLVGASHTLSPKLTREIETFHPRHLVPYDARYLADWAAETYSIEVGDASLVARSRVLAKTEPLVRAGILSKYQHLQFNTLKLVVDSYKLVLLSLWITRYRYEGTWYNVVISGETGHVAAEMPSRGIGGWLANLLG